MAKTIGVGGVFLNFKGDDKEVRDWYGKHLNMDMSDYGTGFIDGKQLVLVSFTHSNKPDVPYVNFRVDDLEELLEYLSNQQVTIIKPLEEYPYGKFAHIKDPFGNVVELWEAYEDEYRKMVEQELINYKKNNHKV